MKKNLLFLLIFVFVSSFIFVTLVKAQTADETTGTVVVATSGTVINASKNIPGKFGLWWQDLKEKANLALTFDPVKKAEKQVQFAEQRLQIAESLLSQAGEGTVWESKAEQMLQKANDLLTKATEKQNNNANWQEIKIKAEARLQTTKDYVAEKKAVLENTNLSKETAKIELLKLRETYLASSTDRRQEFKQEVQDIKQNLTDKIKTEMRGAKNKLQQMNEVRKESAAENKGFVRSLRAGLKVLKNSSDSATSTLAVSSTLAQ